MIRCYTCRSQKLGCSFVNRDWGVVEWPQIVKTAEGDERRAALREEKRRGNQKKQKEAEVIVTAVSEGSTTSGPSTRARTRRKQVNTAGLAPHPLESTPEAAGPPPTSPPTLAPSTSPLIGTTPTPFTSYSSNSHAYWNEAAQHLEMISYEDLSWFDEISSSKSPLTLVAAREAISQLEAARVREQGMIDAMTTLVSARRNVIDSMIEAMEGESGRRDKGKSRAKE